MPSSSTILQKVLWAKLQTWLIYINGEGREQYRLAEQPTSILIQKLYQATPIFPVPAMLSTYSDTTGHWLQTIVTLEFGNELKLSTKDKSAWGLPIINSRQPVNDEIIRIPYSDPEFYRKIFTVIGRAKERTIT